MWTSYLNLMYHAVFQWTKNTSKWFLHAKIVPTHSIKNVVIVIASNWEGSISSQAYKINT